MNSNTINSLEPTDQIRFGGGLFGPGRYLVIKRQIEALNALSDFEKRTILRISVLASIEAVNFNEDWYISAYPDVADAVKRSKFNSGLDHFRLRGYFESRLPADFAVDESFYLTQYPDIRRAIDFGAIMSVKTHFFTRGYKEGRIPSLSYSFSRPCVEMCLKAVDKFIRTEALA
jgi:hypothetical protein